MSSIRERRGAAFAPSSVPCRSLVLQDDLCEADAWQVNFRQADALQVDLCEIHIARHLGTEQQTGRPPYGQTISVLTATRITRTVVYRHSQAAAQSLRLVGRKAATGGPCTSHACAPRQADASWLAATVLCFFRRRILLIGIALTRSS